MDDAPTPAAGDQHDEPSGPHDERDEHHAFFEEPLGELHEAPESRGLPLIPILVIAAVLLSSMGIGVLALRDGDGDDRPEPGGEELLEAAPDDRTFEEVLAELQAFASEERGLPWLDEVDVELLEDDAFVARLLDLFETEDLEELRLAERLLKAVRLVEADVDVVAALQSLLGAGVLGFYDPATNALVVRGTEMTPFARQTLVHELVHALQDQHFELDRPELDERDDEASSAFSALIEGDAVRVDDAYVATVLSDEERRQLRAEELEFAMAAGGDLRSVPLVLLSLVSFPYEDGPRLVEAILEAGGQELLDLAFTDPPLTTEQVLEPERFVAGEQRLPVDPPPADGAVVDEGVFGALTLAVLLGDGRATDETRELVDGWGGDWYVAWETAAATCVRTTVVGDRPDAWEDLAAALEAWGEANDASVVRSETIDSLTFTSCA